MRRGGELPERVLMIRFARTLKTGMERFLGLTSPMGAQCDAFAPLRPFHNNQRGSTLLELAILLPVVGFLIAGIFTYGSGLREIQVVHTAAREGARITASRTRGVSGMLCVDPANPVWDIPCNGTAAQLRIENTDSAVAIARKSACSYLQSASLDATAWDVVPTIETASDLGDSSSFQGVRVRVSRTAGSKPCILCFNELFASLTQQGESFFILEGSCS